jgi:toxin ParE1/3/4
VKVFITDSAIRDLIAIADYIRPHNPDRAATFVDELLNHCEALAEFPQRYPLVPGTGRSAARAPSAGRNASLSNH